MSYSQVPIVDQEATTPQTITPQAQKNVAFNNPESNQSPSNDSSARNRWISRANRSRTNLDEVPVESRLQQHAEIIRIPRAHQYLDLSKTNSDSSSVSSEQKSARKIRSHGSEGGEGNSEGEKRSSDDIIKQLSRLDLFVDLVWVGIIANLSATYSKQAFFEVGIEPGLALLEFILLFIPIWRIWDHLRAYYIDFYTDDILQRMLMTWILVLSVCYGINAPYAFVQEGENSLTLLITIYLIARGTFLAANLIQCIFIPFLRRKFIFSVCAITISTGLWVAAIYVSYPAKIALLILANAVEHPIDIFLASPTADRILTPGWKRNPDTAHYVERHEGFFIIILGEGVFRLIEGSPSGLGLNHKTGSVLLALIMYYLLHWLYFNGDRTKRFVHALKRTWWKPLLWQSAHFILFASLLILAASTLFLIEFEDSPLELDPEPPTEIKRAEEPLTPQAKANLYAIWSASISLAISLFCMTCIALLNRPLDGPKTLLVNSRWVRLMFRLPVIVVIVCLPVIRGMNGRWWVSATVLLLYPLFLYEWVSGLETGWKFIESKGDEE
ncbi:bacterial low temperature requirement A protein-domain-containing protein [Halenospora varia]|nr:bacterial low temperature requirement A protein-domain-containing protein [Halenospora varia]